MTRVRRLAPPLVLAALVVVESSPGRAAEPQPGELDLSTRPALTPLPESGTYARTFAEVSLGKGLRMNNPYRLATPLGDQPESVSLSATYLDLGVGAAFGPPDFLQHGAEVSLSIATDGIAQEVLVLSYLALLPLGERTLLRGRAGMPIVLEPDASVGIEIAAGGAFMLTGGLGIGAELVGDLFFGAATQDKPSTTIPMLALELGIWGEYEVLP